MRVSGATCPLRADVVFADDDGAVFVAAERVEE